MVFEIIVRSYLAQFYPPYVFRATKVVLECAGEAWKTTANVPLKPGWKAVYGLEVFEGEGNEDTQNIPTLKKGQVLPVTGAELQAKQTKPPARFTDGTLIEAMSNIHKVVDNPVAKAKLKETSGLGTEATRAATLELLVERCFIERKGKQILSTKAGRDLVHALPKELTDPVLTARWEDALGAIASGTVSLEKFESLQRDFVARLVETARKTTLSIGEARKPAGGTGGKGRGAAGTGPACSSCKKPTITLKTKKGSDFYKCESCQSCWWPDKKDAKKLGTKWEAR